MWEITENREREMKRETERGRERKRERRRRSCCIHPSLNRINAAEVPSNDLVLIAPLLYWFNREHPQSCPHWLKCAFTVAAYTCRAVRPPLILPRKQWESQALQLSSRMCKGDLRTWAANTKKRWLLRALACVCACVCMCRCVHISVYCLHFAIKKKLNMTKQMYVCFATAMMRMQLHQQIY